MPKPISLMKMVGPSFILLGLGLGSGELILWPYLASVYGMGIIWGALVGITLQFFINMEIERYTLATGESVSVGLSRRWPRLMPWWFMMSTFIPWVWPGIALSAATVFGVIFGVGGRVFIAIGLMIAIGLILSFGKIIYRTQEKWQRTLILFGVPIVFGLVLIMADGDSWRSMGRGLLGFGDGYFLFPKGLELFTFLGALAYSGAGGNLNLAQAYYIREKGYGMGKYFGRITSLFRGVSEDVQIRGEHFEITEKNLLRYKKWWKLINIEHGLVFWLTGLITMLFLALLAYSVVGKEIQVGSDISFLMLEGDLIGKSLGSIVGIIFLIVAAMMLFSTQLSVMDATSRIMAENLVLLDENRFKVEKMPKFFYVFLWFQIVVGIVILLLGFNQPLTLVVIGAVLNALAMFFYTIMILWLNTRRLDVSIRPVWWRRGVLVMAILIYGILGGWAIVNAL